MAELNPDLRARIEEWIEGDPNRRDRDELRVLLELHVEHGNQAEALADRFAGRLVFGTAGLRGAIGAGPNRMNDAVVRQTTAGFADTLEAEVPDARSRGVVVGFDARRRSEDFAREAASVLMARGFVVHAWDRPTPTPTTPFMVKRLGAAAGLQITASHNPPQDNGYKVYWDHCAQIVPPVDAAIAARITAAAEGPARFIPTLEREEPQAVALLRVLGDDALADYRDAVIAASPSLPPAGSDLRVVYTALHGVGRAVLFDVLDRAGFRQVMDVPEQGSPDGAFPTVAFPNPEEPGALDLAKARAQEADAHLILANDPDADRLAVAVPDTGAEGGWRMLTGNEVGALLGDFVLAHAEASPPPLAIASVVSSELLGRIAEHRGARFRQCLTGFKWVMAEARALEAAGTERFAYGFEEALGYCVGREVADKDGISAALAMLSLAAALDAEGRTLDDALHDLDERHGAWVTGQIVRRFQGPTASSQIREVMARIREAPPQTLGDLALSSVDDYVDRAPSTNLLCLRYGAGLRVLIRPSGTEPKVKIYLEWRDPRGRAEGRQRLSELQAAWDRVDPAT